MDAAIASLKSLASTASQSAREDVINALQKLQYSLEKPIDTLNRLGAVQQPAAITKVAIDLGLFSALAESNESQSAEQLASKLGSAPQLTCKSSHHQLCMQSPQTHTPRTARILRYLAALGIVSETGKDAYCANDKTKAFAEPSFQGGLNH